MLHSARRRALGLLCMFSAVPAVSGPVYVPSDLEPWRFWVLQDEAFRQCPFLSSAATLHRDAFRCAWPERLTLVLDSHGGTFSQRWQISGESWVRIPGDLEHWPNDVRVDGSHAQVVARENVPQLHLPPGEHLVSGAFQFAGRPEQLAIDPRTVLVDLTLEGRHVAQPERPGGALWLGHRRPSEQPQRTLVQVYRLVRDEVPVSLSTLIRLRISGAGREELLGRVLPDGFIPVSLESELPARLEPDGRLRVQVRAGTWEVGVIGRGTTSASELRRPPAQGQWADEEIWSFAGVDRIRVAAAEGPQRVDPEQANVPEDWREFPAFRMTPDAILKIVERTRGLQAADDNELRLDRKIWLDFDDRGWTVVDRISGTMRRQWRLGMGPPFELESAREGARPLLISRNLGEPGAGVEVRSPDLDLGTTARLSSGGGYMPATGWDTRFLQASGELNLPPGHRLIAVIGPDRAPGAWLERWGLWAVFGVLVIAAGAHWLRGWPIGLVALVGLVLTYQEAPGYVWLWSNVLLAVTLAGAAPEGRLRRSLDGYRLLSFGVLGLALLPFLFDQVRLALHPELEGSSSAQTAPHLFGPARVAEQPVSPSAATLIAGEAPATRFALPREANAPVAAIGGSSLQEVTVTGSKRTEADETEAGGGQQYAAGTVLQAGPAIPSWHYHVYEYGWSGEPGEAVRFVFVGPLLLGAWRVAGAVLLVLLFAALLEPGGFRGLLSRVGGGVGHSGPAGRSALAALLILSLACAPVLSARAASTPDPTILEQLRTRLTRSPECSPTCADISSATVSVQDDQLEVSLAVSALASLAVPVPAAGDRWQLTAVTLDGKPALAIGRETDGTSWVPVTPGLHRVVLVGRLAASQAIQLAFPLSPHRVSVRSRSWNVTGLNEEQQLISGSLELVDRRTPNGAGAAVAPAPDFPVFVRVTRALNFGLIWSVRTTVERVAPQKGAMSLEVPLLEGESVLGARETIRTADGHTAVVVGLERDAASIAWTSSLAQSRTLHFAQPAADTRIEVWKFAATPQWNLLFRGIPVALPEDAGTSWTYEFFPRPGEQLDVSVSRPQAAAGSALAIDSVEQHDRAGKRSSDTTLQLAYRSTQGGRQTIQLPLNARVRSVELDGRPAPLSPKQGELSLALLPGAHSVRIEWTEPHPIGLITRPSPIDLRVPAANVTTTIELGVDRWPLLILGAGVGPAVLYWGEVVVLLIVAGILGRWSRSPLRTHEWMLLGIGLSMLSWGLFVLVGVWQFAVQWRQNWRGNVSRSRFNLTQVALAVLTACAVAALVLAGIRHSLLAPPDMAIAGPASGSDTFSWFVDRTVGALPRPSVVSAPLWVYRLLMLAWALWMATALVRWMRIAWAACKANGIWRRGNIPSPAS